MALPCGGGAVLALLVALVYLACSAEADPSCPDVLELQPTRIRKKIFCGYDRNVRPSLVHTNATEVKTIMWIRLFKFDTTSDSMDIHAWMVWMWTDDHLKWDKTEYGDIEKIHVPSSYIWVPDVGLVTQTDMSLYSSQMVDTRCHLENDGEVVCVSPMQYSAQCVADITKWPFDQRQCSMRISSFSSNISQLILGISYKIGIVLVEENQMNREWQLLDYKATVANLSIKGEIVPALNYTFVLKRHAVGPATTVVIPAFALSFLTLVVFWLHPLSTERLCLICLNILCHCLFMQHLGVKLPNSGDTQPRIILFFRDSLLMVGGSLLVSLLVRRMYTASSSPPIWTAAIVSGVQGSVPAQVLLGVYGKDMNMKSDGEDDIEVTLSGKMASSKTWRLLATLLDRVTFIAFFLTLLILMCSFIS